MNNCSVIVSVLWVVTGELRARGITSANIFLNNLFAKSAPCSGEDPMHIQGQEANKEWEEERGNFVGPGENKMEMTKDQMGGRIQVLGSQQDRTTHHQVFNTERINPKKYSI